MKLNNNTKRILLFAALLLAAYLISLAFGGKNEAPVPAGTSAAGGAEAVTEGSSRELETAALESLEEDPQETEAETERETETEPEKETERETETVPEEEAEPETETVPEEEAEPETETEPERETETEAETETETETEPETGTEAETLPEPAGQEAEDPSGIFVDEDGEYTDKEHVALYIHTFGHLPSNFITKKEANALGWPEEGQLGKVAPGMSIGGDYFGNYEGLLPKKKGRKYYECDIDFKGRSRGAKRIIFSNDGLIYYTDDHYESFEQLYGGN